MYRCQTEIVSIIILVIVAISGLAIVSNIVINNITRFQHIRSEVIDYNIMVEDIPSASIRTMKISIMVSCIGSNCDKYCIENITISGYNRLTGNEVELAVYRTYKCLRNGVTRIDTVTYYNDRLQLNELIVSFLLSGPSRSEIITRSITLR
uniref:Uncharacterized protein n=1 Tax=Ignisphaera aggregans TaxID=334771 RepID=A0A7C4D299_9CREN